MVAIDPLQILLSHDLWATSELLEACAKLTPEQFQKRFDIGPYSLHETLTYMFGVIQTWTDTLAERPPRPRIEADGQHRTPNQLRDLLKDANHACTAESRRSPLDEMMTRHVRDGRTVCLTRGVIIPHVTTHGMHHRAQCLNMLGQLGASPLPPSSVAEWAWMNETTTQAA